MEKEGFVRCLKRVLDAGVDVKVISTDRHNQIRKLMKVKHPNINHQIDPWHVIKGLRKKLIAAAKKKGYESLDKFSNLLCFVRHLHLFVYTRR